MKLFLVAALFTIPCCVWAQKPLLERKYVLGDTARYELTCTEYHKDKWYSTIVAQCKLTVKKDSTGVFYDEVKWLSKDITTAVDTFSETEKALQVKPYRMPLNLEEKPDSGNIAMRTMAEPAGALCIFFASVSPAMGAKELKVRGDMHETKEPIKIEFPQDGTVLAGQNCFMASLHAKDITKKGEVIAEATFSAPGENCLNYLLDEVKKPVVPDYPNNMQMALKDDPKTFMFLYGRETMFLSDTIQQRDGKILRAGMRDVLELNAKINCDSNYDNCAMVAPYKLVRERKLMLLTREPWPATQQYRRDK